MTTRNESPRLAVLIDADNAQASLVQELLAEVSRYGTATIKRAYGDWTTPQLGQWKKVLHAHAIQPIQQFRYTSGKNASDSALIIDAMDVLHGRQVEGFCVVSSDSDFTRLATRIREAGLKVYGFGEKTPPEPFVAACDKFIYTEILQAPTETTATVDQPKLKPLLLQALDGVARDDGWAALSALGSQLSRIDPAFDSRNYGVAKLGDLVRKQGYLETKEVAAGEHGQHMNLHLRRRVRTGST